MSVVDVLAIAAHPDDAEITCAGLLIRLADKGYKTGILDLTRGELGTRGSAEIRQEEAAAAARIMGLTVRESANLPDSRLTLNDASREIVATCIRRLRPTLVILPSDGQRHPDHNAASSIGYAGIFAAGLKKFPIEGSAHRPSQVLYATSGGGQRPTFYVDITEQMDRKLLAVAAYRSQFGELARNDVSARGASASGDDLYSLLISEARVLGARCGARYAEAYGLKQSMLVDDPIEELRLQPV